MTEVKGVNEEEMAQSKELDQEEIFYLVKDENIDEYYLKRVVNGWKQISETEKTWGTLIEYKYYISKPVVPLIYYILSTNPEQLSSIFEFLYKNDFLTDEE